MALLYGRAGRLTAKNGGFRPGQLLVCEMCSVDVVMVCAEMWRKDEAGAFRFLCTWTAPGTVLAEMLGKEPSAWTRDDAVVAAAHWAAFCSILAPGFDVVFAEAGDQGATDRGFSGLT